LAGAMSFAGRRRSVLTRRATIPPIGRRPSADDHGCDLRRREIAELPQLLGRARVLKQREVNIEGVELTDPVSVDDVSDPRYECTELSLVE